MDHHKFAKAAANLITSVPKEVLQRSANITQEEMKTADDQGYGLGVAIQIEAAGGAVPVEADDSLVFTDGELRKIIGSDYIIADIGPSPAEASRGSTEGTTIVYASDRSLSPDENHLANGLIAASKELGQYKGEDIDANPITGRILFGISGAFKQ